jgi:predicted DNA-binding antitoxin AbrB/MazE fold protein
MRMTIAAKYEDGVFRPLEDVKLAEGIRVEVHLTNIPVDVTRSSPQAERIPRDPIE